MKPIRIVTTKCKRCGKQIATGSHSLVGLDSLKAALGDICNDCITPDERQTILRAQGQKLVEPPKRGSI
jgi:hypothetical protein